MVDDSERDEPVLVRPYITTQPGGHDDRPVPTWPATADLPEDGTRELPGVAVPAVVADPAAKTTVLRRQRLRVLAGIGVLAVLGGAGLFLLQPSGEDDPPVTARPAPAAPDVTGSPAAAPVASAGTISAAPGSRATGRSAATTTPATVTNTAPGVPGAPVTPGAPATNTAPATGEPSPTLSPPPGTARTGPVTAAGGRCLSRGGLFGLEGSPVQTAGCLDVSAQRWTLATDGTLRVGDRCAVVTAEGTVRTGACDDRPAAQWRAGPQGSLVNPETGRCLTDPGSLTAPATVTECTGAATQSWVLP